MKNIVFTFLKMNYARVYVTAMTDDDMFKFYGKLERAIDKEKLHWRKDEPCTLSDAHAFIDKVFKRINVSYLINNNIQQINIW